MTNSLRIILLAVALLMVAMIAEAQQQTKVAKIGWLGERGSGTGQELFRRELRELGYAEGKNIAFEVRTAADKPTQLQALADELVRLNVDVFVVGSTGPALAAKNVTRTIPIVFWGVGDPITAGLIDSLARPGGNITGFTSISAVLAGKRLELLKETIPKLSRVAFLWDPQNQSAALQWKESQVPARDLRLQLHSMEVSTPDKFNSAFNDATKAGCGGLAVTQNPFHNSNQKRIADLALKNRLPSIYPRGDFVDNGGLMSYGPDRIEPFKRAAWMIDK